MYFTAEKYDIIKIFFRLFYHNIIVIITMFLKDCELIGITIYYLHRLI